jgi:2-polyprenyl-6-methoxyphenol hydroxylase-like FAD-dependent oxidoreductase
MRIAIIGGGIGGLTAALALRQFGFEPTICEQAPELLEVGAAILMWPNAIRVLHRLGVAAAVRRHGAVLEQAIWLNQDGKQLNRFQLPKSDEPAIALHRGELQQLLVDALPRKSIRLGCVFEKFEAGHKEMVVHFADGSSVGCDVLIGADGLHSRLRAQLLNDGQPVDRGYIAWRGVTPHTPKSVPPASAIEIYGNGQRFGIGPLGWGKVGWWCSVNKTADAASTGTSAGARANVSRSESSEDHDDTRKRLLKLFDGWCEPVSELIRATPLAALVCNPVFDRPPVRKWGIGPMTLLGDAIHPLTPNLGQGGCLAIEDAAVLARCLKKYASHAQNENDPDPIQAALRRFETLRYSRTATVARCSRMYGVVGQWEKPSAVGVRGVLLSTVPGKLVQNLLRWVFDYDAYGVSI